MRNRLSLTSALVTMLILALALAACGDDDGEDLSGLLVLDGEETVLALDAKTAKVLEKNKISVDPVDPSSVGGEGISLPIVGGEIDAESLAGTIDHAGGIRLSSGGTRVKLTDFVVDMEAGTVTATGSDGSDLRALNLDLDGIERTEDGEVIVIDGISATLTNAAARALNDALRVDVFKSGLAVGQMTVTATVA